MDALPKDIKIKFGDTKEVFFRVRDRVYDTGTNTWVTGSYRDLTGYTVLSQIRKTADDADPLVAFTTSLGDQTDVELGRGAVLLKLTPAETAALDRTLTTGVWDVQFTDPGGDTYTYIEGAVTFSKDVTR